MSCDKCKLCLMIRLHLLHYHWPIERIRFEIELYFKLDILLINRHLEIPFVRCTTQHSTAEHIAWHICSFHHWLAIGRPCQAYTFIHANIHTHTPAHVQAITTPLLVSYRHQHTTTHSNSGKHMGLGVPCTWLQ